MSSFEIPEPTANLKALAKRHPVDYQKLYQLFWDAFDDYEVPIVNDPSFTKAGDQSQDAIDIVIAEEVEAVCSALPSLYYYSQREAALRDMVCMVALHRQTEMPVIVDPTILALEKESPKVLSELREFFVARIGDDYLWEKFDAPDYISLTAEERADIDDFVREVQYPQPIKKRKGERLKPHESFLLAQQTKDSEVLRSILWKLAAPEPQWVGVLRHVAVEAARALANQHRRKQRNPGRIELLVEALFDEEEWQSSDAHTESIDISEVSQKPITFPNLPELDASGLDRREALFYRTLDIAVGLPEAEYQDFVERIGRRELFDLLKRSVDAFVWDSVLGGGRTADKQYLHSLQEDEDTLRSRGWYLAIGMDPVDPDFFKKYVGQTKREILRRAAQHRGAAERLRRYLDAGDSIGDIQHRNGLHLMNFIWASNSTRTFKFIRLGELQDNLNISDQPTWLNIVEMYFCLAFQSLQPGTLSKYLGEDAVQVPNTGLNIALPLYQTHKDQAIGSTVACLQSDDPEVVAYAKARLDFCRGKANAKLKDLNWAPSRRNLPLRRLEELNWDPVAVGKRKSSLSWKSKFRDPNPQWGEPTRVKVFCKQCGFTSWDTAPVFHIHTGAYVIRRRRCLFCEPSDAERANGQVHARKLLWPVEAMLATNAFV